MRLIVAKGSVKLGRMARGTIGIHFGYDRCSDRRNLIETTGGERFCCAIRRYRPSSIERPDVDDASIKVASHDEPQSPAPADPSPVDTPPNSRRPHSERWGLTCWIRLGGGGRI